MPCTRDGSTSGIGRSGGRNFFRDRLAAASRRKKGDRPPPGSRRTENGLLIPAPPSLRGLAKAPRISPDGGPPPAGERRVGRLRGSRRRHPGLAPRQLPFPRRPGPPSGARNGRTRSNRGSSAAVQARAPRLPGGWVFDSPPATTSARPPPRGGRGIPEGLRPLEDLERPYVAVSADVVVGPDDESARQARSRLRAVGQEHPKGRGSDAVPWSR